jgi:hypothetical protein
MSKKILLTAGAALMVVAGWLGSAPAEADRVSPPNDIQRSHIVVPKFVDGGYFEFPDSPLVAPARGTPVVSSTISTQQNSGFLFDRDGARIGQAIDIR